MSLTMCIFLNFIFELTKCATLNKMEHITNKILIGYQNLHISAPGCHPQRVKKQKNIPKV